MEAQPEGHNVGWQVEIDGYKAEQIGFHVPLMARAGLIVADDSAATEHLSSQATPVSISSWAWAGRCAGHVSFARRPAVPRARCPPFLWTTRGSKPVKPRRC